MLRVMPETWGRDAGSSGRSSEDTIFAVHSARASGEPDAVKAARPVRREVVGVVRMRVLAIYPTR